MIHSLLRDWGSNLWSQCWLRHSNYSSEQLNLYFIPVWFGAEWQWTDGEQTAGCTVARQKQSISGTKSSLHLCYYSFRKITFELRCETRSHGSVQQSRSDVSQIAPLSNFINNSELQTQTCSQEDVLQKGIMRTLSGCDINTSRHVCSFDQTFGCKLPAVHFHLNNSVVLSCLVRDCHQMLIH